MFNWAIHDKVPIWESYIISVIQYRENITVNASDARLIIPPLGICLVDTWHWWSHCRDVSSMVGNPVQLYFSAGIVSTKLPAKSSGAAHCAWWNASCLLKPLRYFRLQSQTIGLPLISIVWSNQAILDQHGSTYVRPLWSNNKVCRPDQSLQTTR